MTVYGRSSRSAVALALGLAGLIGICAASVHATPAARTAASPFELTLEGTWAWDGVWFGPGHGGTFTSRAPFCATGTFTEIAGDFDGSRTWGFMCDDGSGSLTVSFPGGADVWRIVDASGSYAGLRGKGSPDGGQLSGPTPQPGSVVPFRITLQGFVDRDGVAPTIAFTSARATKLRRPAGAYALTLGIALRDDVADNAISYTVRVCAYTVDACAGRVELARSFGTDVTGAFLVARRIRPPAGARSVQLQLTGEDPVGNAVSISRALKLPR